MSNKTFKEQTEETKEQGLKGDPKQLYLLGHHYEIGIVFEKDYYKAYACYLIAKNKGYSDADIALTSGTIITNIFPPKLQENFAKVLWKKADDGDVEAEKILHLLD